MHSKAKGSARPGAVHAQPAEQIQSAQDLVASVVQKSTATLEEEEERCPGFMRWELGACWVQHHQSEAATLKEKKDANAKEVSESDATSSNKSAIKPASAGSELSQGAEESAQDSVNAAPEIAVPEELMKHLPSCALSRLNESAILLNCKVLSLCRLVTHTQHFEQHFELFFCLWYCVPKFLPL